MKKEIYIIDDIPLFEYNNIDNNIILLKDVNRNTNFNSYDYIIFYTYNINNIIKPLEKIKFLYYKALDSHRNLYIKDCFKNTIRVTLKFLIKLAFNYIHDYVSIKWLIRTVNNTIDTLKVNNFSKKFSFYKGESPIYIKVNHNFGVFSGGEVSHSSGVVNSLKKIYNSLIVFTTDCLKVSKTGNYINYMDIDRFKDFNSLKHLYFNISGYKFIIKRLKNSKPLFIYQRLSLYSYLGIKLANFYNVPLVLEINSLGTWTSKNWGNGLEHSDLAYKIEKLNLEKSNLIVCVSDELKDLLIKIGVEEKKILVNYNGVDTDKYSPEIVDTNLKEKYNLNDKIVIGFIGSFALFHGVPNLAKAYGKLIKLYPDYKERVRLILIGNGTTMDDTKKILKRYKVNDISILTGNINYSEVPRYLGICDILVAPHVPNKDGSPFFGSPTKLFEYMAMGKAIIASNLGQIGKILENNKTALLVEPGNVDNLLETMKMLIDNSSLRAYLGDNARNIVIQKYTWDINAINVINKLKNLY